MGDLRSPRIRIGDPLDLLTRLRLELDAEVGGRQRHRPGWVVAGERPDPDRHRRRRLAADDDARSTARRRDDRRSALCGLLSPQGLRRRPAIDLGYPEGRRMSPSRCPSDDATRGRRTRSRPRDEVLHSGRHEHLARPGDGHHPGGRVHDQAARLAPRRARAARSSRPRGSRSRALTTSAAANAHRIASTGRSNVAKNPSPAVSCSRPPKRRSSHGPADGDA